MLAGGVSRICAIPASNTPCSKCQHIDTDRPLLHISRPLLPYTMCAFVQSWPATRRAETAAALIGLSCSLVRLFCGICRRKNLVPLPPLPPKANADFRYALAPCLAHAPAQAHTHAPPIHALTHPRSHASTHACFHTHTRTHAHPRACAHTGPEL